MGTVSKRNALLTAVVSLVLVLSNSDICLAEEVTVFTPRKTAINAHRSSEMSQESITRTDLAHAKIIKDNRWKAVIKSSSTTQYNSHGYAWQIYGGGAAVNIDDKDVAKFWTDGSYQEIKRHESVRGDIIVMTDPLKPDQLHSAIVINVRWCMSKWGNGPLVLHKLNEHPFGQTYRYFRQAKVASPSGLTIVSSH